jgi:adenine-specific DNA-methyltransferase
VGLEILCRDPQEYSRILTAVVMPTGHPRIIQRCLLITTDPGDLVLDPTCGSGTTAYVAEQWGRRWITIETSRVALVLARARLIDGGAVAPSVIIGTNAGGSPPLTANCPFRA